MYKNRIINRTNNYNSNLSDGLGGVKNYNKYYDFNELEDFVNEDNSCRNSLDHVKGNKSNSWCQVNKRYNGEGALIKNTFIFIENADFPVLPSGGRHNKRALEIKVDNDRNVFINGKKMDTEISKDGTKVLTLEKNEENIHKNKEKEAEKQIEENAVEQTEQETEKENDKQTVKEESEPEKINNVNEEEKQK
ncbi:MAG: hypothetical protein ACERLG_10385 [Sedimentibacter sp.]